MKPILSLLMIFILSGCGEPTEHLTLEEARQLPTLGVIQIRIDDLQYGDVKILDTSDIMVCYGAGDERETVKYAFIGMEKNIQAHSVFEVPIPDYGYRVSSINFTFTYKTGPNTRVSFESLTPVYSDDKYGMDNIKNRKIYNNNEEVLYEVMFNYYVKPNLKLNGLHGYIEGDFSYGRP